MKGRILLRFRTPWWPCQLPSCPVVPARGLDTSDTRFTRLVAQVFQKHEGSWVVPPFGSVYDCSYCMLIT